jgi:hypothetical protein
VAKNLSRAMKGIMIGIYAGGDKSGVICDGKYQKRTKEDNNNDQNLLIANKRD